MRPVAAAMTKMISMLIRTLFHPPRSTVNEMYFSSPYRTTGETRIIDSMQLKHLEDATYLGPKWRYEIYILITLGSIPVRKRVYVDIAINMSS